MTIRLEKYVDVVAAVGGTQALEFVVPTFEVSPPALLLLGLGPLLLLGGGPLLLEDDD
jgi:hypothetical protein